MASLQSDMAKSPCKWSPMWQHHNFFLLKGPKVERCIDMINI